MASSVMVTTLFTDLVDSTALASRLGPEAAEELRRAYFIVLRTSVADTGGSEVKSTGDGLHAVFPSVSSALSCAVATQQAIDRHNQTAAEPLAVRIGISHGEVEPADDGDYYGASVVEAARLCAKADGGEIVTTELVRALSGGRGGHHFEAIGAVELKGLGEPVGACRVLWVPTRAPGWSLPLPPRLRVAEGSCFVGREREFVHLEECRKAVTADRGRRAVLVGGEAGIGKTSLVSVVARHAYYVGIAVLYGRCDEELGIPYQPWAEVLGELIEHAPEEVLRAHVEARAGDLATLVPGLANRFADVPPARSSNPDTERHLLFSAVLDLLGRVSAELPMLILLDDLHWADRPTLQLLRHVVSGSASLRLMVLGTFRPADVGVDDPLAELLAALHREIGVERMALGGLGDLELLSLLEAVAGHEVPYGLALRDALGAETDGNPFFVLEILRHLAETGALGRGDGQWVARPGLSFERLPVSVREVIGRRVHQLGGDATGTLAAASVIGRDFDLELLSAVVEKDPDVLLDVLDRAIASALIADAPDHPGCYTFVHALIQHALYDELSAARRQRLHRRVAEALESLPGDREDRVGELAQHWYAATQPADLEKTIEYSVAAGDRAQRRLAPDEAVRWYRQALEILDRFEPDDRDHERCEVLLRLGTAQRLAGGPGFRETLLEAAGFALRLGDTNRLVDAALTNTRSFAVSVGSLDRERVDVLARGARRARRHVARHSGSAASAVGDREHLGARIRHGRADRRGP